MIKDQTISVFFLLNASLSGRGCNFQIDSCTFFKLITSVEVVRKIINMNNTINMVNIDILQEKENQFYYIHPGFIPRDSNVTDKKKTRIGFPEDDQNTPSDVQVKQGSSRHMTVSSPGSNNQALDLNLIQVRERQIVFFGEKCTAMPEVD